MDPNGGKFEGEKFFGMYSFGQRNLIVRDIDLAKRIAIKDAEYFIDRYFFLNKSFVRGLSLNPW